MKNFILLIVLLLFMSLIAFSACKDGGGGDTVVEFKGGNLTTQDLDVYHNMMKKSRHFRNEPEKLTPEFVLNHAINMQMIITKGIDKKLHLDPVIRGAIHEFMADMFIKIMQDQLVPQIDKADLTEDKLKEFYNKNKDNYKTKAIYTVEKIKTEQEETARQALEKIKSGEMDFHGAVSVYSIDEKSKIQNGNIGSRSLSRFRKSWQPAIASLEMQKVSGPHKIKDAWYIFRLIEKTEPRQYSFEERKAFIRNDMLYAKYKEEWQKTYDALKKEFKVKIDEEKFETYVKNRTK